MALHFVSTSILSSEDGIDFSKETQVESEEARKIRVEKEKSASKPLYLQLAEQEEKKQQERDLVTKMMFAPPKAIDEDEFEFLNSIQQNKQRYLDKTKLEEDSEIERFRNISKSIKTLPDVVSASVPSSEYPSSSSHTSVSQTTIAATTKSSNPAAFQPPIIKVVKKRKVPAVETMNGKDSDTKKQVGERAKDTKTIRITSEPVSAPVSSVSVSNPKTTLPSSLSMLGDYPSTDED